MAAAPAPSTSSTSSSSLLLSSQPPVLQPSSSALASTSSSSSQLSLLQKWTKEEVHNWFERAKVGTNWEAYATLFNDYHGAELAQLVKQDFIDIIGPIDGDDEASSRKGRAVATNLFNAVQALKAPQQAPPQQRQQQASSTVDPHEAKQLVTFMLQLNGAKQSADEFSKPPRLCANHQHFKRVGLEESLIATYAAFAKRLRARREAAADAFVASAAERQNNPLVALQSAPGGGKSFFLDQLAELNEDDLRRYCEGAELVMNEAGSSDVVRELMNILRESIPVCVTYNSGTTWSINVDTSPEEGLAMRILGAYFMKDNFDWDTFIYACKANLSRLPWPHEALNAIGSHALCTKPGTHNRPILLCVDEVIKASKNDPSYSATQAVVSAVGVQLNQRTRFNAVISTLDVEPIRKEQTCSGRSIAWIPLLPIAIKDAISLFSTLKEGLHKRRQVLIELCIADCGGHPRTLEWLYAILSKNSLLLQKANAPYIMAELARFVLGANIGATNFLPIVARALHGKPLLLDIPVIENRTVSSLIAEGIYLNSLDPKHQANKALPRLSPFVLRQCALETMPGEVQRENLAKALERMLDYEAYFHPLLFEGFHAWWEVIYRIVKHVCGTMTIPSLPTGTSSASTTATSCTLAGFYRTKAAKLLKTRFIPRLKNDVEELNTYFPFDDNEEAVHTKKKTKKSKDEDEDEEYQPEEEEDDDEEYQPEKEEEDGKMEEDDDEAWWEEMEDYWEHEVPVVKKPRTVPHDPWLDKVILPKKGNPGFDVVIIEEKAESDGYVAINVECRYSEPETITKQSNVLGKREIEKKFELMRRAYEPYVDGKRPDTRVGKLGLKMDDVFLVICAWRGVTAGARKSFHPNILMLDCDRLERLYTPSLISRPQFYSMLIEQKIQQIETEEVACITPEAAMANEK